MDSWVTCVRLLLFTDKAQNHIGCLEELSWSLSGSNAAFNEASLLSPTNSECSYSSHTVGKTVPQFSVFNSVSNQTPHAHFQSNKVNPVPHSYSFRQKNAFNISEEPESFNSLLFKSVVTLKLVSISSAIYSYFEQKPDGKNREFPSYFSSEGLC